MFQLRKCAAVVICAVCTLFLCARAEAADGAASVATIAAPGGGQIWTASAGADGVIHLLCDSADGPYYVCSTDNGKTFSTPLAVVDQASRKPGLVFNTWDMAIGAGGSVHVALGTNA